MVSLASQAGLLTKIARSDGRTSCVLIPTRQGSDELMTVLESEISEIAGRCSGVVGVEAWNLNGVEKVSFNSRDLFPTASVIKLPILVTLYNQVLMNQVDLSTRVNIDEIHHIGGSGILKIFGSGLNPTIKDVATLMMVLSDNTATNVILDVVGGVEPVNKLMDSLGLPSIKLHNRIDFEAIGSDIRRLGESSAVEMCELNYRIATRELLSPAISEEIESILEQQQYLNQFPRYMQVEPFWRELNQIPRIRVSCKTGFFMGTRVDAGIVRFNGGGGFAYSVFNNECADKTFLSEAEGDVINGLLGSAILKHWWPKDQGDPPLVKPSTLGTGK